VRSRGLDDSVVIQPRQQPPRIVVRVGSVRLAPRPQELLDRCCCRRHFLFDAVEATQPAIVGVVRILVRAALDYMAIERSSLKEIVMELSIWLQVIQHVNRRRDSLLVRHRAVQVAVRDRINIFIGADYFSALHEHAQILHGTGALVIVQLTDEPAALRIDFNQEPAVDVMKLGDDTFTLLDVILFGDRPGRVVKLHTIAGNRRDRTHRQLGVRED
jgi:hypothetical protein